MSSFRACYSSFRLADFFNLSPCVISVVLFSRGVVALFRLFAWRFPSFRRAITLGGRTKNRNGTNKPPYSALHFWCSTFFTGGGLDLSLILVHNFPIFLSHFNKYSRVFTNLVMRRLKIKH